MLSGTTPGFWWLDAPFPKYEPFYGKILKNIFLCLENEKKGGCRALSLEGCARRSHASLGVQHARASVRRQSSGAVWCFLRVLRLAP